LPFLFSIKLSPPHYAGGQVPDKLCSRYSRQNTSGELLKIKAKKKKFRYQPLFHQQF